MCYLKADSPNLLDEWLQVLQRVLRLKAASPLFTQPDVRPSMKGPLIKMKHGCSKRVWCALIAKTLFFFRSQQDKVCPNILNPGFDPNLLILTVSLCLCFQFPLGQVKMWGVQVQQVDRSTEPTDEDLKTLGPNLEAAAFIIRIQVQEQSPTFLLLESLHEKVSSQVGFQLPSPLSSLFIIRGQDMVFSGP